jgi:hypothetical protein
VTELGRSLTVLVLAAAMGAGAGAPLSPPMSASRQVHPTATGTLTAWDAIARTLTLKSAAGLAVFYVAEDARLWLGRRHLPFDRLGRHLGAEVTVAYSETDGRRVTHTVRLAEGDDAGRAR